jgi:hypothetical protein
LGGELTIQMLQSLGTGFNVHEIDEEVMARAIGLLEQESRRFENIFEDVDQAIARDQAIAEDHRRELVRA